MDTPTTLDDRTVRRRPQTDTSNPVATRARPPSVSPRLAFWSSLIAGPVAIGAGLGVLSRSRRAGLIAGGLTAVAIAAVRWQLKRVFTPEPDFLVEQYLGEIEIRRYAPRIEARTTLHATSLDDALRDGFRRLAIYLDGGNHRHEELPITAPIVMREKLAASSPRIPTHGDWFTVAVTMPPDRTMDSLPRPDDHKVRLYHVPERRTAVMRFSGKADRDAVEQREHALLGLVAAAGLGIVGTPLFAGFDPPTTLPFLRRNEVWVELMA